MLSIKNGSLRVNGLKIRPYNNATPIADAGNTQNVTIGTLVTLDGSGSSDANGDMLTYSWTLSSKPNGSISVLSSATEMNPTFTPDIEGTYVFNLVVYDGKVSSTAASVIINASGATFLSMVGTYDGIANGGSFSTDSTDITVEVTGSTLKVTDKAFFAGTCIYTATIMASGNAISDGTYQCSDFSTGSWSLMQMKVVDNNDIYISILKNGTVTKRLYGMKAKSNAIISSIMINNISTLAGTYSGVSNGGPFLTDSTDITVEVTNSTLKVTDKAFFAGTCIYTATIMASGNAISDGTYQCSDFSTGSWSLMQMKVVDNNDIYISILKGSNMTSRMYGWH